MTVHLLIKGKVQGVYFRASAKDVADQLGLSGWVRNTGQGEVEMLAAGREDSIREFIAWCKKGPGRADVTKVVVTAASDPGEYNGFRIIR